MSYLNGLELHKFYRRNISQAADYEAQQMRDAIRLTTDPDTLRAIADAEHAYGIRAPEGATLEGKIARLTCPLFWRRQIKKRVLSARENHAAQNKRVGARTGSLYIDDFTCQMIEECDRAASERLQATTVVNTQTGETTSLLELAEAAKVGRVAEIYTMCKGLDTRAKNLGWTWCMTTLKLPGEYHPNPENGARNYAGFTFEQMHQRLNRTWHLIRTQARNRGIDIMGLRVSEPHRDGTPHAHIVVYMDPAHRADWEELVEQYAPGHQSDFSWCRSSSEGPVANSASYLLKYVVKAVATDNKHLDKLTPEQREELRDHITPRVIMKRRAHGWRAYQFFGIKSSMTSWRLMRSAADLPLANPTARALRSAALQGDAATWLEILNSEHAPALRPVWQETGDLGRYGEPILELQGTALVSHDGDILELIPRQKVYEIALDEGEGDAEKAHRDWVFAVISNCARGGGIEIGADPYDEPPRRPDRLLKRAE
jgi:hypothetical protein